MLCIVVTVPYHTSLFVVAAKTPRARQPTRGLELAWGVQGARLVEGIPTHSDQAALETDSHCVEGSVSVECVCGVCVECVCEVSVCVCVWFCLGVGRIGKHAVDWIWCHSSFKHTHTNTHFHFIEDWMVTVRVGGGFGA